MNTGASFVEAFILEIFKRSNIWWVTRVSLSTGIVESIIMLLSRL